MKLCLIGYNLTSLILAYILSKKKIHVQIYVKKAAKTNFSTRTLGITQDNLKFLNSYFKNINKITNPIKQIKVFLKNIKGNQEILFNDQNLTLFYVVKYNKFFSFINSKIKRNNYISFKYINRDKDLLSVSKNKNFKLIINCDNSNILTKKYLNKSILKNYNNKAYTTIILHKKILNNIATQIFTENGPIAFLPISNDKTSVVFSYEIKKKIINDEQIIKLIREFNPKYKIISLQKIQNFDLKLKLSKKYFHNNVLFFGDCIHSIHPVAGQGFNMTIRDIKKLNEIVDEKLNLGLNLDKSIYEEFQKHSKSYNTLFAFSIDFIYEFFRFNKDYIPKDISEKIFTFINAKKDIKKYAIKIANQGII